MKTLAFLYNKTNATAATINLISFINEPTLRKKNSNSPGFQVHYPSNKSIIPYYRILILPMHITKFCVNGMEVSKNQLQKIIYIRIYKNIATIC